MHLGKKIRLLRNLKGYTQSELSAKVNKTRALISHIEQSGKVNSYTLQDILKVLGLSMNEFENFDGKVMFMQDSSAANEYGKSEVALLRQQIENIQKENKMLKDLIVSQKKIIAMLERKKK